MALREWKADFMNAHATPIPAQRSERWSDDIPVKLRETLNVHPIEENEGFSALSDLAQHVVVDGYRLDIESAITDGSEWVVPGTIFVTLGYDMSSDDPAQIDDSYPFNVHFTFEDGVLQITRIEADVSSFYE